MSESLQIVSYLGAAFLFILSLGGLSAQETAKRGNVYGIIGISIAILVTLVTASGGAFWLLLVSLAFGGAIGAVLAARVEMTEMPELVAILHSFVGLAAVLVGFASYIGADHSAAGMVSTEALIHSIEIYVGIFIGGVTFTGSVVAFGKLKGSIKSKPLILPLRNWLNLAALLATIYIGSLFVSAGYGSGIMLLLVMTAISFVLGWHLVMAIGGADMPVVVSMLNSYSGWAAAATGFMLANDLLIITGALVGSSGAILSQIMCKAMNRSIWNVIFGGFGASAVSSSSADVDGEIREVNADEVSDMLKDSGKIMVIPGYGMAVAQAQHPLKEVMEVLKKQGKEIIFGIHPVAGRLPGHMNVLLAEANIPYDVVFEMEEVNEDWDEVDLVIVMGANDIVNPGALDDPSSPIFGMPVLECWKAKNVIMMKRSMGTGYSGVQNPLFFKDNTHMLFGDAKDSVIKMLTSLQG